MDLGDGADTMMDHSMKMYFHASPHSMILFKGWMTHNWQQMLGSCVAIFLIAMLYEGLKIGREMLQQRLSASPVTSSANNVYPISTIKGTTETYGSTETSNLTAPPRSLASRIFNASHAIQTLLHFVQVWVSFVLMLVFMTYNIWLCLAVTLGAAAGYFVFAWLRPGSVTDNEHCN